MNSSRVQLLTGARYCLPWDHRRDLGNACSPPRFGAVRGNTNVRRAVHGAPPAGALRAPNYAPGAIVTTARCAGVTLIEMVVVIILLGIIFAIGSMLVSNAFRSYFVGRDISDAEWQGRIAVERMTRELRAVRTPADLTIAPDNEITFNDTAGNTVRFYINGTTLTRSEGGTTNAMPLADKINSLNFYYLQKDGETAETSIASNVYYISVKLRVVDDNYDETLRTTVRPRHFEKLQ